MIENLKSELAKEIIEQFLDRMKKLGIQKEEAISLISEISKGDNHDTIRM